MAPWRMNVPPRGMNMPSRGDFHAPEGESQRQILQDESLYKIRWLVTTAADTPRRVAI